MRSLLLSTLITASMLIAALALIACNRVDLKYALVTDAGDPGCSEIPTIPCDAVDKSATTCTGDGTINGSNAASLPTDASFAPGCQAYFRARDCSSRGYCTCDFDDSGVPAYWNCHDTDGSF